VNENKVCPLCKKQASDFLLHLRIHHKIKSAEEFEVKINSFKEKKLKQDEFSTYVDKLKKMITNKEITFERYRELITKWKEEKN